jgi:hypothetical protein
MIRFNKKDMALVAFATGLLAFEAAALQESVPAVKQSLARLADLGPARIASRLVAPARAAGAAALESAGQVAEAVAEAPVEAPAIEKIVVAARAPEAPVKKRTRCLVVAASGADAATLAKLAAGCPRCSKASAAAVAVQMVAVDRKVCRENAESIRRAISERRHDRQHSTIEVTVEADAESRAETAVSTHSETSSR